ncbi:EAL-associated domain-containing protein [Metabacillus malikii]|uniref:EAL domain-containing protein (Putative c-di-GMP-specific phosphodiesterase class I) n=1 Tax=Metabacillus malikii TaxID=1504265 RepID=A0ABT9ZB95_9BACI|nr:EAL-associated domain-containing protein [Metabacillus malikii]MDQ0229531.1 EAL domain-containing protein (putative c-di-GMP-specific phosphodiesterase class I) [Metabacillus malikii]
MDPLDIMSNMEKIIPHYQAIFSADEQRVIGYEILGRILLDNDEFHSLGSFFQDDNIPDEFRIEVDDWLVKRAIDEFIELNDLELLLFINRDANLLMLDHGESFLQILLKGQEKGLQLTQIVIEITEYNFKGDISQLYHLLQYYKTYGIKIAIDNIGKASSNLDRIGHLSPDILKIDLQPLRLTSPFQSYYDVLFSISLLARKIGATLLYEDIEVNFQLQYAWKNGGRYYQGYFLDKPKRHFIHRDERKELLINEFQHYISSEKKKLQTVYSFTESFHNRIHQLILKYGKHYEDYNDLLKELAIELDDCCFRIYICDEDGFQQSVNVYKNIEWEVQPEYYMKNWSWRPYFLANIVKMRFDKKGFLSDVYSDIEKGVLIRTFSYPLNKSHYLFLDLSYDFLYEQESLL